MSLRALIAELSDYQEDVEASSVVGIVRGLLDKFFAEHDLPIPKIKFSNKSSARYIARCKWISGASNTELEVQRSALGDEKTLRRVLTHELIHHWAFLRVDQSDALAMAKLGLTKDDGHGQDFMQYAAKINAVMGSDYVTKVSDQSFDTSKVPPFYVLIEPHGSGSQLGYSIAVRPSAKQKDEIADRVAKKHAKLFRVTDGLLFSGATTIKRLGGYSVPKDQTSERSLLLRKLYDTGKAVTL